MTPDVGTRATLLRSPRARATVVPISNGVPGAEQLVPDVVNSGVLPPTQHWLAVPALGPGRLLNATLLTEINGTWSFQAITFTTK